MSDTILPVMMFTITPSSINIDEFSILNVSVQELKNIRDGLLARDATYTASPWSKGTIRVIDEAIEANNAYRHSYWPPRPKQAGG